MPSPRGRGSRTASYTRTAIPAWCRVPLEFPAADPRRFGAAISAEGIEMGHRRARAIRRHRAARTGGFYPRGAESSGRRVTALRAGKLINATRPRDGKKSCRMIFGSKSSALKPCQTRLCRHFRQVSSLGRQANVKQGLVKRSLHDQKKTCPDSRGASTISVGLRSL
jgi:hypothetical protein